MASDNTCDDYKSVGITNFNPLMHNPPKYDIFGRLKKVKFIPGTEKTNLLDEKDNIKVPWTSKNETMTRTKLLELRKNEKIPDISYDLDRDGFVGGRDYFLARRFDRDKDGKLNEIEKNDAYNAILNNVEDNYIWNVDKEGPNRGCRIMQKRGKVIDGEDFLPLRETYPIHPLSSKIPSVSTLNELKANRKKLTKSEIHRKIKTWEKSNPNIIISEPPNINTSYKPDFNSVKDKKLFGHKLARLNCGLKENEDEIKIVDKDPSLAYVENPKHKTRNDIREEIAKENIEQSKKLSKREYKDEISRLNEREAEVFEKLYSNDQNKQTLNKLKKQRRKENLDYNVKTFSKQTIGVHGHELPKFSEAENMKEFWKLKEDYVENPKINSQAEYKENVKFWKKPEELLINEHREEIASPDPFSKVKVIKEKNEEIIIKVNSLNHFKDKGFDPDNPKPIDIDEVQRNHIYKWTTLVNQFAPQKFKNGRLFDSLPESTNTNSVEEKGMYSSFVESGVFESNYLKGIKKKKKDDKFTKMNDNGNNTQEHCSGVKESLFQKYSSREANTNKNGMDKPKLITIVTKGF